MRDEHRALRISGEETAKGRQRDAWSAADDAMLQRIAHTSMEQLAAFLTSPEVAPNAPDRAPSEHAASCSLGARDSSPEAAGIFRIFRAHADPVPSETAEAATARRKRRSGATAAPPASAARGGIGPGNAHTGGRRAS